MFWTMGWDPSRKGYHGVALVDGDKNIIGEVTPENGQCGPKTRLLGRYGLGSMKRGYLEGQIHGGYWRFRCKKYGHPRE